MQLHEIEWLVTWARFWFDFTNNYLPIKFYDGVPELLSTNYGIYEHIYEYIIFAILHFSGTPFLFIVNTNELGFVFWFFAIITIFAVIFDFLTLSFVSSKNQKFLQKNPEKIPHNTFFIISFLLWRIFLLDIFVASSLLAYFARINLSKKSIFILTISSQIIRISLLYIAYCFFV